MNIAFRVHLEYSAVDLGDLYESCKKMIIYQHDADDEVNRTHIHGLCIGYDKRDDTFRKYFKGKYEYALTLKNKKTGGPVDETYIAYMSKGCYDPVFVKNFSDEEIAFGKSVGYKPEKRDNKGSHTDKQLAKKGLTHWDVVEWVRERAFKQEVLTREMGYVVTTVGYSDYSQIYDLLINKLEELKIKTHQSDLERWFCTIVRNDAGCKGIVKESILNKYSK